MGVIIASVSVAVLPARKGTGRSAPCPDILLRAVTRSCRRPNAVRG